MNPKNLESKNGLNLFRFFTADLGEVAEREPTDKSIDFGFGPFQLQGLVLAGVFHRLMAEPDFYERLDIGGDPQIDVIAGVTDADLGVFGLEHQPIGPLLDRHAAELELGDPALVRFFFPATMKSGAIPTSIRPDPGFRRR